jgi:Asp/Glu/hydantoin racemase
MDYDRSIHNNPDAQAWAKFFIETTKDIDREVFGIEGYMIAWFSDAMMAMHDHLYKTEIVKLREALADIANIVNPYEDGDTMQEIARDALKEKE